MNTIVTPTGLFAYTTTQTAQLDAQAAQALNSGIDRFLDGQYDAALLEFRRAIALSPVSDTAIAAYKQIAQTYTQKNDSASAIGAYKELLRLDPGDAEARLALGNLYYFESRYSEARQEYEQAVRLDPSAANRFSLGQVYLAEGNYSEAEAQFRRVQQLAPREPGGYYGLGQVYARQGRDSEAIDAFESAINAQNDFWDAYVELGYVYANQGNLDAANSLAAQLSDEDAERAAVLSAYVYEKTTPKMNAISSSGSFPATLGPGTQVSALSAYLAAAEGEQAFSIQIYFNKEMDPESVENVVNWRIGRAVGTGLGDSYNYNLAVPETELTLSPIPIAVNYDSASYAATVWFMVRQNASADGTLDPSHIQFSFSGMDRFGQTISSTADQYTGVSGFA